MNKMERPTVVDLFSGVGGFSLGFSQAGFNVELAADSHDVTIETYEGNFPNTTTSRIDLSNATTEEILADTRLKTEEIDVVVGGPPCQGFSIMGNQDPDDDRNKLLIVFAEHIISFNPSYFVLENVKGLLMEKVEHYLEQFLTKVRSAGYQIVGPKVLNAADHGIPQSRERLFLLGYKSGCPKPDFPPELDYSVGAWEALKDLPAELNNTNLSDGVYYGELGNPSEYVNEVNSLTAPNNIEQEGLSGMDPVDHTQTVRDRFAKVNPGEYDDVSQFYRLEKSEPANTLRAGSSRERGTHTPARPIHPISPRCITVREAARLQSFPDWFEFHPTKYHGLRQIGNSVPPLLAKRIGEQLSKIIIQWNDDT